MLSMVNQESPDALYDAHDSNAVLLLAVFIALVKSTPKRDIELVDVIILLRMLWLIIICGFSLAHLTDEYRTAKQAKKLTSLITTPSALLFRVVVVGLISVYNVWFWFRGVGFFQGDASCETHAFFSAKLAANGPLQGFYKFTSVILILMPPGWILAYLAFCVAVIVAVAAIAYALALVMLVLTLAILYPALAVFAIWKYLGHAKERRTAPESLLARERPSRRRKKIPSIRVLAHRSMVMMMFSIAPYQPDMDRLAGYWTKIRRRESTGGPGITRSGTIPINKHQQKKISNWWATYLAIITFYFIFSIIGIELTIYWNTVENSYDIGSTGQLIPFVIGILSAIKVLGHVLSAAEEIFYGWYQKLTLHTKSTSQGRPKLTRHQSFSDISPSYYSVHSSLGEALDLDRDVRQTRQKLTRKYSVPSIPAPQTHRSTPPRLRSMITAYLSQDPSQPSTMIPPQHRYMAERTIRSFTRATHPPSYNLLRFQWFFQRLLTRSQAANFVPSRRKSDKATQDRSGDVSSSDSRRASDAASGQPSPAAVPVATGLPVGGAQAVRDSGSSSSGSRNGSG